MNFVIYLLSGFLFAAGLGLSGMIQPEKVRAFLAFGMPQWDVSLLFVLGAATPVYGLAFAMIRHKGRALSGAAFPKPAVRPVDRRLILGAVIFGVGWGLLGLCPGPALVRLAWPDVSTLVFVGMMFAGFEIQRRWT